MSEDVEPKTSSESARQKAGLVSLVKELLSHDAHPLVQFLKYGFAGGVATLTYAAVFTGVTETWFPVESGSKINFTVASVIAFFPSNAVAYVMNILWVFKPGRHSRLKEVFYFLSASGFAFVVATLIGQVLVNQYDLVGLLRFVALGVSIVVSVMVNYAARKFFIFKG